MMGVRGSGGSSNLRSFLAGRRAKKKGEELDLGLKGGINTEDIKQKKLAWFHLWLSVRMMI